MDKPVLDATCGGRMMWFDKQNPLCLYMDKRVVEPMECCDGRSFRVEPDMVADFTNLPFDDESFYLVVFDPPHLKSAGKKSYMAVKYGVLDKDWQDAIRDGFRECMRVLKPYGTLVFKWSEVQIPTREIINAIGLEPLFGHRSGKRANTHWMTFLKVPEVSHEK